MTGSAYPAPVPALLPRARELAARIGGTPSRNALMRELRIGADKARAILAELHSNGAAAPTEPGRATLRSVPALPQLTDAADLGTPIAPATPPIARRPVALWPLWLLAAPAFVAIWSGWVGLGGMTGFGIVHPLPGIADGFALNSAITLPIGVEAYAAYALRAWLTPGTPTRARRFAKWSTIGALILGALGQVAYHLLAAAGYAAAPAWVTTLVACLPVAVLGMGAALAHLLRQDA